MLIISKRNFYISFEIKKFKILKLHHLIHRQNWLLIVKSENNEVSHIYFPLYKDVGITTFIQ